MVSGIAVFVAGVALIIALRAGQRTKALQAQLDAYMRGDQSGSDVPARPETPAPIPEPAAARPTQSAWSKASGSRARLERPKDVLDSSGPSPFTSKTRAFFAWMAQNWIYPVAAVALVLAAVFLVQYSIEAGLLTPQARIFLGLVLGGLLIAAGEALRRTKRVESDAKGNVAATLAGAGIGALFATILAAFHEYAMLSEEMTLAALAGVAVLSLALGWVHGVLLGAIGILAGTAAPFLLGSKADPQDLLYGYFLVVALLGLAMGGLRGWSALSLLAAVAPVSGLILARLGGASELWHAVSLGALALAAMALPSGHLIPRAEGPMAFQLRHKRTSPTVYVSLIALTAMVGSCLAQGTPLMTVVALGLMAAVFPIWTRYAPALSDQILLPSLGVIGAIIWHGVTGSQSLVASYTAEFAALAGLVALNAVAGASMLWRAKASTGVHRDGWALVGLILPGAVIVALELFWQASVQVGAWPWAGLSMALAVGYACVAIGSARTDAGQGVFVGGAAAATFALIGFAIMLILSSAALTFALAILMIAAAAMDRRFDLPGLHVAILAGTAALAWRFVIDPGVFWLMAGAQSGASHFDLFLTIDAVLGGTAAAWVITSPMSQNALRSWSRFALEALFINALPVVLAAVLMRYVWHGSDNAHAMLGTMVTAWGGLMWLNLRRSKRDEIHWIQSRLQLANGAIYGFLVLAGTGGLVSLLNPVAGLSEMRGWLLLNDLLLGYLMPACALLWIARRGNMTIFPKGFSSVLGCVLAITWIALNIRNVWQGNDAMRLRAGIEQGEIYTYTVAILLAGAASIALALRNGLQSYRRVGLALIAIAAAKAFTIDASDLDGLMRVGAFLALGLSLAGVAWLNSWVSDRMGQQDDT